MKKLAALLCLITVISMGCSRENATSLNPQGPSTNLPQNPPQVQPTELKKPQLPGTVMVMVDNYYKARPQSGLDKADLVYEILAEGGITRFLALFYSQEADKIGPIRSARYYFVQLARGYNSPYAHAGGNLDALETIQQLKIKDLDEIYNSSAYFWRDKNRKAPHNLYSSTAKLVEGSKSKGYDLIPLQAMSVGNSWSGSTHQDLRLDYSKGKLTYVVNWHYNGQEYERKINGQPHVMEDGTPIKAQNILVISAVTREVVKEELESEINLISKGQLVYFIEGKMLKGSWEKTSAEGPIYFKDEQGKPIKIKDGQTWVQVLPSLSNLTY